MTKKALITAAAGGIGAVVAVKAKTAGYDVTICDIDTDKGKQLAEQYGLRFISCDLAKEDNIVSMVRTVGTVHLLVNNGGITGPMAPVTDIATNEWRYVFDINVTAQFITCREMVPYMKTSGGGCIINMSSAAAKIGYKQRSPYGASKRAVLGLTAALAREVSVDEIRVNAILPGAVRGERFEQGMAQFATQSGITIEEAFSVYLNRQAIKRLVEPDEIADLILFLSSASGRSITGQFISIDNGYE